MANEKIAKTVQEVLKLYAETKLPVTQNFYQGLCLQAITEIEHLQSDLAEANKNIDIWRETCQLCERKVEVLQAKAERKKLKALKGK